MTRSVRIHEFGGPEVLRLEDVVVGEPGAGEVRLRLIETGEQIGKIVITV